MDSTAFSASPCGRIVHTRTGYDAFVPNPLPPPVSWTNGLAASLERTSSALAKLAGSPGCAERPYLSLLLARDAVAGVRSEGKPLTMSGYYHESVTNSDTAAGRLAANYVAAIMHGHNRLEELPLSLRLLRELHLVLVSGVVDPRTTPGEFRRSQNWLGSPGCTLSSAAFVPPPPFEMQSLLDNWERYLHEENDLPVLIRLSWAHFQYMVIQPFLDMNMLTGAVLGSVALQHLGVADRPLPLFGRWLERHSHILPTRMLDVCARGCWEEWLTWHLHGIADAARETLDCRNRLHRLHEAIVAQADQSGLEETTSKLLQQLFEQPVMTVESAAMSTGSSMAEAASSLQDLVRHGFATADADGGQIVYSATRIIEALEDTAADFRYRPAF